MLKRSPKNLSMLLLGGAAMPSRANLQLANNLSLYVANEKLRHTEMIALLSLREDVGGGDR